MVPVSTAAVRAHKAPEVVPAWAAGHVAALAEAVAEVVVVVAEAVGEVVVVAVVEGGETIILYLSLWLNILVTRLSSVESQPLLAVS